jgi:hypothetical protein
MPGQERKGAARRTAPARSAVGVVGGDATCVRALVQRWTGRPMRMGGKRTEVVSLPDQENRREVVVLTESPSTLEPWPGGPLIWLLPERGPSQPELALLRQVLYANERAHPRLCVLVCIPHDVAVAAANADLDTIADTLRWGVNGDVEIEIEAVWVSGNEEASIDRWLGNLGTVT